MSPVFRNASAGLRPATPRHGWILAAAGAFGCALSVTFFLVIQAAERREAQARFEIVASQRMELLRENLGNSLESLHALQALFETGFPVDRQRFRGFVASAIARRPELQAFSWSPRVPAAERVVWEERARADGFPGFTFTEPEPGTGRVVPAHVRDDFHFPVIYIEPLAANRDALGLDLNFRAASLQRACDSGNAVATPLTRLVQEKAGEPGFIVYLPLYGGAAPTTAAERRAANTGFVGAVFRVADLVQPALADLPGIVATLRDRQPDDAALTYAAPAIDAGRGTPGITPRMFPTTVADRTWEITFTPTAAFSAGRSSWTSWSTLAGGLLVTALLVGFRAADLRRSAEIARANAALQTEVAERKRAEERAAAANRAKSDFLTSLSHEIRTPLNSILGYAQIFERDPDFPRHHHDAVGALANSGRHLLGLLNSMLDLSRIEAGRMNLERDVFDLAALVRGLVAMFLPRSHEKNLTIRVEFPDDAPRHVCGDEGKLRQVLINLIGNAVKFTPRGEVIAGARPDGVDRWRFDVIDTGIGMSDDEVQSLFTPFHQTAAGRRQGGTGLGLALARGLVELMGGALEVHSERGTGTRFSFSLPLPAALVTPLPASAASRLAPDVMVRTLIVDDNRDNRIILESLLADLGCRVAGAATPAQARDIVRQNPPHIVFIDVLLPDLPGPDLLAALQADGLPADTVVVFHTAAVLEREAREKLRATGADLLAKPFRIDDLCTCLRRLPHVRFAEPAPADDRDPPDALRPGAIDFAMLALPEELCARMSVAAELHSTTVLKGCLEELRQLGGPEAAFAAHLRQLLRAYDLTAIARELQQVRVRPPSVSTS